MSVQGLPRTSVEFWQRYPGTDWPMCGAGPCQLPAVLTRQPDAVQDPRCAIHVRVGVPYVFIEPGWIGLGTITTTYVGRPRR